MVGVYPLHGQYPWKVFFCSANSRAARTFEWWSCWLFARSASLDVHNGSGRCFCREYAMIQLSYMGHTAMIYCIYTCTCINVYINHLLTFSSWIFTAHFTVDFLVFQLSHLRRLLKVGPVGPKQVKQFETRILVWGKKHPKPIQEAQLSIFSGITFLPYFVVIVIVL